MTKKYLYTTCLSLLTLFFAITVNQPLMAQTSEVNVSGVVMESGTGLPLKQVIISVASTGTTADTDEEGAFTISVPDLKSELIFNLPGYNVRRVFLTGSETITVTLVAEEFASFDNSYNTPIGVGTVKDAIYGVTSFKVEDELKQSKATSFDHIFQGRVPGMAVNTQSGMPGTRTYMKIKGISSLYGSTEPILFIDGMMHNYSYADVGLMEGFALNPMDVVDIDDISDITIVKNGISHVGSLGANGLINVNTEQKAEASTVMKLSAYGGITSTPAYQDVMDPAQFKNYFSGMLGSQGYTPDQINTMYPWLNGDASAPDYYKYNNNTNWQDQIYSPASVSKFHFFLKGGDDIATYNISTGYLSHNGVVDNSRYTRYNLRINGNINITDKFSITPNAKLSLADSKLANQGASVWKNPNISALLKPPTMTPYARDAVTGDPLDYLDDIGDVYPVSNPVALTQNASGTNRNYHFLSSITAAYRFNEHFKISTLFGLNFNNARENIFLPDLGVVRVDSAYNSPGDFIYEFRSTQNYSNFTYTNNTAKGHSVQVQFGFRYLANSYKYNLSTDLNTPSDDFKSLGQGSQYSYLRSTTGDFRELKWISYFSDINYSFRNKYFINANISYDGNSTVNSEHRFAAYPSIGAAWRISSEGFLSDANWLEDLKIRGSYSVTGNMLSSVYDFSKLYYTDRRINSTGVLVREIIPNENLDMEKRSVINGGLDLSLFKQQVNLHADFYKANVNNLVIRQELPASFGYTDYYDNGGKIETTGFDISLDTRFHFGDFVWTLGGSIGKAMTKVNELKFINPQATNIVTTTGVVQYVTSVDNPVNAFWGYKTDGLLSAEEAGKIMGPKGYMMQEGDIKFVDDGDGIINDMDKQIIGDPNPDFFGGIFTSFIYKSFKLSALFNYSVGGDLFNYVRYNTESMSDYVNQSTTVLNSWTPGNTSATLPRMAFGDPSGNNAFSDRWIEDGTFLRLGQLTLSYDLPKFENFLQGITVYVTGSNLFTVSNYSGYDPDFSYVNHPFYMGIDYGKTPNTQSFIIGVKLDL